MPDFCHLHVHSYYSLLDGLAPPSKLVAAAVEHGYKALALTDHGSCGGLLNFQKACKEKGIKPILGNEIYITENRKVKEKGVKYYHLILLAKNSQGIKNLMKLTSMAEIEGKYIKGRIDFDLLSKHSEGLICTTACSGGELPTLLWNGQEAEAENLALKYKALFGEDYYIEIMRHKYHNGDEQEKKEMELSHKLYALSKKLGIKAIATNDAHYAKRTDAKYHDILLSIQTIDTIKNPDRFTFNSEEFYIKGYDEMHELFKDMPEILSNTLEIVEKVESDLLKASEDLLPNFSVPEGYADEKAYLKALVKDGMIVKKLINIPEYRERIKFEMDTIIRCNYVRYFLILWDIINFARRKGISVGVGRGSAVGCLCLYVLDVTRIDPIKYDLLFERFLNPERITPPDVDVDFDYYRRDEIFEYVYQKYGRDHCSKIGTYNSLQTKAVIRATAKALDLGRDWESYLEAKKKNPNARPDDFKKSLDIADFLSKMVPKGVGVTLEAAMRGSGLKGAEEFRNAMKRHGELLDCAMHIEKTVSSAGVHPAGIVICKNPIVDHVPMRESKGQLCSMFTGPEVEELGLLKFDFLALKTLTVIDNTLKMIKKRHNVDIDIDKLEPNDPKVLALFNGTYSNMDNRGIFQFESYGISQMSRNIRVDTIEDLIVGNALYRPGPLKAGVPEMYADFKHGRKPIKFSHPKMGEILNKTYGLMCFDGDQKVYADKNPIEIKRVSRSNKVGCFGKRIEFSNPKADSFESGMKDVYEYKLSNGFSICSTKDHAIMSFDGSYSKIDDFFKNEEVIPYVVGTNHLNIKKYDDDKAILCHLLGLLVGGGNLCNSSTVLCLGKNKEWGFRIKEVYEKIFKEDVATLFFATRCWYLRFSFKGNKHLFGKDKKQSQIKKLLFEIGLDKKAFSEKRIPFSYLENNREYYSAFLAGYMDSDGTLGKEIRFSSANPSLLEDCAYLLWSMGYRTYKSNHHLIVSNAKDLFREIKKYSFKCSSFSSEEKLLSNDGLKIDAKYVIDILKEKIEKSNLSIRQFSKRNGINRSTLSRIRSGKQKWCKYLSVKSIVSKEEAEKHAILFIKERIFIGKRKVYDLSMGEENNSNFIIQPGIVVHNCYQENFMKVAQELALFTKGQSDTLRKIVGKKKPELIKKERLDEKFVEGCKKNGIDEKIAKEIFQQIEFFGGYGFNRSHSAAYAYIAYQTAYLKVYYPLEFMCNLLSSEIDSNDKGEKMKTYWSEAERMKIVIKVTNVNKSGMKFNIESGISSNTKMPIEYLRSPITSLDGIGDIAAQNIVDNQPYADLKDFLYRVNTAKVNSRVFQALINAGAFDDIWNTKREELLATYETVKAKIAKEKSSKKKQDAYLEEQGDAQLLWMGGKDTEIKL